MTIVALEFVGSSKKDLLAMPEAVIDLFGYALDLAQRGRKHADAKPLKGFGTEGVLKVVYNGRDAYRSLYSTKIGDKIYVLHCFQKKSPRQGGARPRCHDFEGAYQTGEEARGEGGAAVEDRE